jgi:hypothetical protein
MKTNHHQLIIKPDSIMILSDFVQKGEQNPAVYSLRDITKVEFSFKNQSRLKNVALAAGDIIGTLLGATSGSSSLVSATLRIEHSSAQMDMYELLYGTMDNAKRDVSQLKEFLNGKLIVEGATD